MLKRSKYLGAYGLSAIIFFILAFSAIATSTDTEYLSTGQNDSMFSETDFNHLTGTDYDLYTKSISSPKMHPLVADLDADLQSEIIILDDVTIRLYQNKSLSILDAYTLPAGTYTTMYVYDIDGDGKKEIITANDASDPTIVILEYNGTSFYNQTQFAISSAGVQPVGIRIACKGEDDCIITLGYSYAYNFYAYAFNSTQGIDEGILFSTAYYEGYPIITSIPVIGYIEVIDYDIDGDTEYIMTNYLKTTNDNIHKLVLTKMYFNGTDLVNEQTTTYIFEYSPASAMVPYIFTSPLTYDWDGSVSNGLETAIGMMTSATTYKINTYSSTGVFLDDHPESYTADGQIISNIARACIFSDTNCNDFCVLGFSNSTNTIDLLCGSETTGESYESREFSMIPPYNITVSSTLDVNILHSIQAISDTYNSINPSEFSCSYGILEINNYQSWLDQFTGTPALLSLGFQNPKQNSAVIMSDAERTGHDDMLALTSTNLWYIDDRFSNSQATLGTITINPSPASTWKQNTSVGITAEVNDVNSDSVRARAILYQGEASEQDSNWTSFASSGTTFSFTFTATTLTSNSRLMIYANDIYHNDSNISYTKSFSVGVTGIEFGDAIFTDNGTPSITPNETCFGNVCVQNNNSILGTINSIDTGFNLGIGKTAVWLIVMMIVGLMIWVFGNPYNPTMSFVFIAFAETIMLLIGFFTTLIGWGTIIFIIIVMLAVVSMQIRKFFTGNEGGG